MSSVPPTPTVSPLLKDTDLKWYLSGGTFNSDPKESTGGEISATEYVSGSVNGLFDRVEMNEAIEGDDEYRCVYLKNTHVDRSLLGAKVWIESGTPADSTAIQISVGAGGTNGSELKIPDENIAPTTNTFESILEEPTVANIGDLGPGDYIAIWIRYFIGPGTASVGQEVSVLRVDGEREPEAQLSLPPVNCPAGTHYVAATNSCVPDPITCPAGTHYNPATNTCIPDSPGGIPPQCPTNYHYDAVQNLCIPNSGTPSTVPNFEFAASGDFDCVQDTQNTFDMVQQQLVTTGTPAQMGIYLIVGDFAYTPDDQSCFIDICESLGPAFFPSQYFPVIGNHDDEEDGTAGKRIQIINAFPNIPSEGWYAFTRANIRFIGIDTQKSYLSGSPQHTFIMSELQSAAGNPAIKWKVLFYHKPSLISDTTHAALTDFRNIYHPAFDTYKVDVIITGHAHVYFRSKPVRHNPANPALPIVVTSSTTSTLASTTTTLASTTTGNVLYDSNVHGHWNNGTSRTVTDSEGSQLPNGKGFYTAASGNPELIIDGNGIAHLHADAGHGRIYIKALNYNSRLEFDFMFEDTNIDNISLKLRSRHQEGGSCSNRFGGFGCAINRTGGVEFQAESCHNNHENSISGQLNFSIQTDTWYRAAFSCYNNVANTQVEFKLEIDKKDGQGFKTVLTGNHTSPQDFYMDLDSFMQESYFWIRINNSSTGQVGLRDVQLFELAAGGGGTTGGGGGGGTDPPPTTGVSPDGRTFITVGTGGRRSNHTFTGADEPYVAKRTNTFFGSIFCNLTDNGTKLKIDYIENGGTVVDTTTLVKAGGGTGGPPVQATCPTGYHLNTATDMCDPDIQPPDEEEPPPEPVYPQLKIGFCGDTPSGSVHQNIWDNMASKGVGQVCHVGDVSYSNSPASTTDAMTSSFPAGVMSNAMVCLGNHDHPNEDGSQSDLDFLIDFFNLNVANQYCSKKQVQNVYFIAMNTQDTNVAVNGGTQHLFVQAALAEAAAAKTAGTVDWIIVIVHKPLICAPSDHPADEEGARSLYQAMFNTNQVDFVVSGHNHLFEISHPLSAPTTTQYTETDEGYDFRQTHGQIYMLSGGGGRTRDSHSSSPTQFRYLEDGSYGYHMITIDTSGKNALVQVFNPSGTELHSFEVTKGTVVTPPPSPLPCPQGQHRDPVTNQCVPNTNPPGTGGQVDSKGIRWLCATGQQGVIAQSRDTSDDDRWSGNVTGVRQYGFETTMILDFRNASVGGDGHMAMKHWGPNHSGNCGQTESGSCCCWYDTGIRANGDIQLQIERPHPHNEDFTETTLIDNIGKGMEGNVIGLKWVCNPVIPGGSADNGGIRLRMWVDTDGLSGSLPTNNWRLVYDFIDNGQILGDYDPVDEFDFEVRNSNTSGQEDYGGGLHWRKRTAADANL